MSITCQIGKAKLNGRDSCNVCAIHIYCQGKLHTCFVLCVNRLRRVNNKLLIFLSSVLNSRSGTLISRLDCVVFNKTPDLCASLCVNASILYIACYVCMRLTDWVKEERMWLSERWHKTAETSHSLSLSLINSFRIYMKTEQKCLLFSIKKHVNKNKQQLVHIYLFDILPHGCGSGSGWKCHFNKSRNIIVHNPHVRNVLCLAPVLCLDSTTVSMKIGY